jgi:hypothetical protein
MNIFYNKRKYNSRVSHVHVYIYLVTNIFSSTQNGTFKELYLEPTTYNVFLETAILAVLYQKKMEFVAETADSCPRYPAQLKVFFPTDTAIKQIF